LPFRFLGKLIIARVFYHYLKMKHLFFNAETLLY